MNPNFHPNVFWVKIRTKGSLARICVRIFTQFTSKSNLVIDLNIRRNQPQCSNFAFKVQTSKNLCGLCGSRGGRCQGANGNSSHIFSAAKYIFIIKYSKAWRWCRTFSAHFFDPNVRHQACLRSICVEHSGQLPQPGK